MAVSVRIALPAYNEEDSIRQTIGAVSGLGTVIVYDNCSTDETRALAEASGALVINSPDAGYEAVIYHIARDFKSSSDEVLVILDGDGEVGLQELPAALSLLGHYDGVVGVRERPKRIAERLINRLFYYRLGVKDVYCGFKVLRKTSISDELSLGTFSTGLLKKGAAFQNIPVKLLSRDGTRLGSVFMTNWRIFLGGLKGYCSQ